MIRQLFLRASFKKWSSFILKLKDELPISEHRTLFSETLISGASEVKEIDLPPGYAASADPSFTNHNSYFLEGISNTSGIGQIFFKSVEESLCKRVILDSGHHSFPTTFTIGSNRYLLCESSSPPYPTIYLLDYSRPHNIRAIRAAITNSLNCRVLDPILLEHSSGKMTIIGTPCQRPYLIQPLCDIIFTDESCAILDTCSIPFFAIPGRLAGSIITHNTQTYIPVQTSKRSYGDGIQFFKIDLLSGTYDKALFLTSWNRSPYGPHTISLNPLDRKELLIDMCVPTFSPKYLTPKVLHYLQNLS